MITYRHRSFPESMLRSLISSPLRLSAFLFFLIVVVFCTTNLLDFVINYDSSLEEINLTMRTHLNCTAHDLTGTCPTYNQNQPSVELGPPSTTCPHFFNWINEDLKPWAHTGITREMVENARRTANFRLVILNGRAYVETYLKGFQCRDTFSLWGFLQLLRKYPGKIPDLDLMFDCVDWPVVMAKDYYSNDNTTSSPPPPPLFRYCADNATLDIVFPDWTFWGWPETNIGSWDRVSEKLREVNKERKWIDREPLAFWKGNPNVSDNRQDLLNCNLSRQVDWNARLFTQNWDRATEEGFKYSHLEDQCKHRYKIYIEGSAWSVSEKYILACDSMTLLVKPRYYDFYSRSLMPMYHYWPISNQQKCKAIKFAVDWGNTHTSKAQEFGKAADKFIRGELKMEYIYDYMFHLLTEYGKLLRYKPTVPPGAKEMCLESMACNSTGLYRKFMMESMVKQASTTSPCLMPPYDPKSLHEFAMNKDIASTKVENWEKKYLMYR